MGAITELHEKHRKVISTFSSTVENKVAVISLEKFGLKTAGKIAGKMLTPAKWLMDYTSDGTIPDKVDTGLYAVGALAEGAEGPALAVEFVKAAIDDDIENKLAAVRRGEAPKYRKFIKACYYYGMSPPMINAQTIASKGGTAWRHKNGLWVYIVDRRNYLVADFQPHHATMIMQPVIPIQVRGGRFKWHIKYSSGES